MKYETFKLVKIIKKNLKTIRVISCLKIQLQNLKMLSSITYNRSSLINKLNQNLINYYTILIDKIYLVMPQQLTILIRISRHNNHYHFLRSAMKRRKFQIRINKRIILNQIALLQMSVNRL